MKRKLLSILLLLAILLTACGQDVAETSSESSLADASSAPDTDVGTEGDRIQKLDALYGESFSPVGLERFSISVGKTATVSREGEGKLTLLTDGKYVEKSNVNKAVHFSGKEEIAITLDMGEAVTDIAEMGISLYTDMSKNASLPKYVQFYVSQDGNAFLLVGTVYRPADAALNESHLFLLSLQSKIGFRYLKAVIPAEAFLSTETYVDEICVFDHREKSDADADMLTENYYINDPLPEVTEKEYWTSSEADYTKEQNLVLKKSFRIMCPYWIDSTYATAYYNAQPSAGLLTNGRTGTSSIGDGEYFHITKYLSRTIIFDLEKISGVSSVTVGMLKSTPEGILLPDNVRILGSMDGKIWGELAAGTPTVPGDRVRMDFSLKFDKTAVRFVAVEISADAHLWVDEITVNGTKSAEDAIETEFVQAEDPKPNQYASPDALGGVQNILLTYTFKTENPAGGLNTVDELLPYVAYLDSEGNIKDSFFDAFLFLACSTVCPSGGRLWYNTETPARASDWIAYEENLFDPHHNVNALTVAVDRMDEALGTDTEMPVYFPIFSIVYGDKGFGDVDGDGIGEDFTDIEDRKKVIKWWIDRLEARFAAGEYDNLKLDGFYWNHEQLENNDPHELELIHFTADYLHSKGYYFIWIPYYLARGFDQWESLGFDAAVMQPNYMFNDNVPEDRLYYNALITKSLGMGVEIEADYAVTSNPALREKYMAYLRAGVETGYMNSIKIYYQDAGPGVLYNAYNSTDSYYHEVYDATYRYAKGTLSFAMKPLVTTTFTGKKDTLLTIFPKGEDGKLIECALLQAPKYGSVQQSSNGRFYYDPAEGFVGTDTFVVCDPNSPDAEGTVITVVIE